MPERIPSGVTKRVPLQAYLASDGISAATGKTLAVTISKNGAAFGNPSGGATNATEIANGCYYVDLSVTDTGTAGPLFVRAAATGVDDVIELYEVANAHNNGFDGVPAVAAGANGGLPTGNASGQVTVASIVNGAIAAATFASGALDAVWSTATRTLTALGFHVQLATTQDQYAPSKAGDAMTLTAAYDAAKTAASQSSVDDLPTNAELSTALGTADDAVLAAIAALNNLSAAQVNAEADTAISDAALATASALATAQTAIAAIKTLTDKLTFDAGNRLSSNVKAVNDVIITGAGVAGSDEWRPV